MNLKISLYHVIVTILISLVNITSSYSQLEAKNWYFGGFKAISFESTGPVKLYNSKMNTVRGTSTMSDRYGNLLFYSNGHTIWNKNHDTLKNGVDLINSGRSDQAPLIIPMPGNSKIYYLFTTYSPSRIIQDSSKIGFWYHILDMSKDKNRGEVILKNQLICRDVHDKLTATLHANKKSVWIMVKDYHSNKLKAYLFNTTGLNLAPVESALGTYSLNNTNYLEAGQFKFSPSGQMLANIISDGYIDIFDFDNISGKASNVTTIELRPQYTSSIYGIEFSHNSDYLYFSCQTHPGKIIQIDLTSKIDSIVKKSLHTIYTSPELNDGQFWCLQIGIDKKIYIARPGHFLGCINKPDLKGDACNYVDSAIYFAHPGHVGMSLPTFLQSYFYLPDIEIEHTCLGDSTSFNLKDTSNIDSVLWKFGDGDSVNEMFPKHVYADTGYYNVQAVLFHDNTSDTFERDIRISNYAFPNFGITDSLQCLIGNEFQFYDSSFAIDGNMTYEWGFGDSTGSFFENPTKSYTIADTFPVTLTVTSSYGCESSVTKNMYVRPMPVASMAVNDTAQCYNEQFFVISDLSTIVGDSIAGNQWVIGTDTIINQNPITIGSKILNSLQPGTWKMQLVTSTSHNCTDTTTQKITIHQSPVTDFSINDSVQCLNENSFQFLNQTSFNKAISLNYEWSFGDNTFSFDSNGSKTYTSYDSFDVQLLAISPDGCRDSVTKQVMVLKLPKADIVVNDSSQCLEGNQFLFSNLSGCLEPDRFEYHWEMGDYTQSRDSSPVKSYLYADTFLVSLVLSDSFGCLDTAYKDIFVRPVPKAAFSIDNPSQCLTGNNFNFNNTCNISSGILNYKWFISDSLLGLSQHYNNLTIQQYGNRIIKLVAESDFHCLDSTEQRIFVNPMPVASFTYSVPCLEKEISFTDKSHLITGNISKWNWYFTEEDSSLQQNPLFAFNDFGDHTVKLIVHTDSGCVDTVNKEITIYDHAPAVITERVTVINDHYNLIEWIPASSPIVSGYQIQKSTDFGNFVDFKTYPKDSLSLTDFSVSPDYNIYTYHILTIDSCSHTSEPSNIAQSILLEMDSSEALNVLRWSAYEDWNKEVERYEVQVFNDQIQSWEKLDAFLMPTEYTDSLIHFSQPKYCYRIVAFRRSDDLQSVSNVVCADTWMNLVVPNAFTPNNDGVNDVFLPKGLFISEYKLSIYNRWGEKLFESSNIKEGWDGTFRSKTCPLGTYYYNIKAKGANGKSKELSGTIQLLR